MMAIYHLSAPSFCKLPFAQYNLIFEEKDMFAKCCSLSGIFQISFKTYKALPDTSDSLVFKFESLTNSSKLIYLLLLA